ncbi:MAG TPA: hypothetical protein VFQ44_12040 [Streptosporangiaceae bacterium]|nr:hypothetical protein [Streptosporangiaceae bacterium]
MSNNVDHRQLTRLFAGTEQHSASSAVQNQESSYIVPDLPSVAWPSIEQFGWVSDLNATYDAVRREFLAEYKSMRHYSEDETLAPVDLWRVLHLFLFGRQVKRNVQACPATIGTRS